MLLVLNNLGKDTIHPSVYILYSIVLFENNLLVIIVKKFIF